MATAELEDAGGTRRQLLALVVAAGCGSVFAQRKVARIGLLTEGPSPIVSAFLAGLRDHGWVENENLRVERAFTGTDPETAPALARALVAKGVDVIVARASTFVEPARRATTTVPIVFLTHNDPVGTGHVKSLAHPGGNITGVSTLATELHAKQLQLLRELLPQAARLAVLYNPSTPSHRPALAEVVRIGPTFGFKVHVLESGSLAAFSQACANARAAGDRADVDSGGFVSYGADTAELARRGADLVDKILRGAKPAELPVELPTTFELVINLKAARALGVQVPPSIRLRANDVVG
jgi:putative ABC transport system substrate-binding protein